MDKRRIFKISSVHRRRGHPMSTQTSLSLLASPVIVPPHAVMTLTAEESRAFIHHLVHAPPPHEALRTAAARYWARVDQSPSSPVC
ncbi:MAG: hypothetical protein C7B46_15395 [Sulfobacillus benefaciens]|uniref:DUF1778 domain-containing protein n=1 Tax=Sulfobacillus benefaciens TaxID=453960 RepID=A0A2T2XCI0_9FIRM|nr:MAG: hypothetical protein C7B46_15395 [Sulfobacillus benefaciens]